MVSSYHTPFVKFLFQMRFEHVRDKGPRRSDLRRTREVFGGDIDIGPEVNPLGATRNGGASEARRAS